MEEQILRKLHEQIARGKCGAHVACCHVPPDDMYWTKKCVLMLKPGIVPRVSLNR